ncbi:MAG: hypothetical protein Q9164_005066 [Protoblastenia rupestris]
MAESAGPKAKKIPSWQEDISPAKSSSSTNSSESLTSSPVEAKKSLLEKASRFLEDDEIRDAPMEKKHRFLESKGLSPSDIELLLNSTRPVVGHDIHQTKDISLSADSSPKGQPPIITYPEFLLHSQKRPPLITSQRLLLAGYIISGAAAAIYGTSKYLVEPMIESLSSARRSLSETTLTNMATLTDKLECNVSRIPATYGHPDGRDDSDAESTSLDGAHFFSRTAGTQTSPHLSRSASISSAFSTNAPINLAASHSSKLAALHTSLKEIRPSDSTEDLIKHSVDGLREYLEGLPYRRSTQIAGFSTDRNSDSSTARMKAEIRGMKGALLSARNFPPSLGSR